LLIIQRADPPDLDAGATKIYEIASGRRFGTYAGNHDIDYQGYEDHIQEEEVADLLALYGVKNFSTAPGLDIGEPLVLSHFSPSIDAKLPELAERNQEDGTRGPPFPRQRSFVAKRRLVQAAEATQAVSNFDWHHEFLASSKRTTVNGEQPRSFN
jgi:hypothetical protein